MTGVLAQRSFRLLWAGETASGLGTSVTSVATPLIALGLGAGPLLVGLLTAATWLPWLIVGLPAGAWIERARKRPLMIGCDLASAALLLSVPVASWCGVLSTAQLLVVTFLVGVANVFFVVSYRAYLPILLATEDLTRATRRCRAASRRPRWPAPASPGCSRRRPTRSWGSRSTS